MEIINVKLHGKKFKLFKIEVFGEKIIVAEEKLNNYIEKCIDNGGYYSDVKKIDEMYGYYVPQEIADTLNETYITMSIEDVYDKN